MFEFICIVIFLDVLTFQLNSTEWLWSNFNKSIVGCCFCRGFWIGLIVMVIYKYTAITIIGFPSGVFPGAAIAAVACLTYTLIVLKINNIGED